MRIIGKKNEDKGTNCHFDEETGMEVCEVMVRHRNKRLSTGSNFNIPLDQNCKLQPENARWSVFDDDEEIAKKRIKEAESECRRRGST